jgi:hypothetical protein
MDWPFVGQGIGQGFGLVQRRGALYISQQASSSNDSWNCGCADDFKVPCAKNLGVNPEFSVVLDFDRARVFFEANGKKIQGSTLSLPESDSAYRFIASVPDRASSVTIVAQ